MHLRLASTLGKHLHEVMGWHGPVTSRQMNVWSLWHQEEWNRPSRSDHYLMQIAATIHRGQVRHPRQVRNEQFHIPFLTNLEVSTNDVNTYSSAGEDGDGNNLSTTGLRDETPDGSISLRGEDGVESNDASGWTKERWNEHLATAMSKARWREMLGRPLSGENVPTVSSSDQD